MSISSEVEYTYFGEMCTESQRKTFTRWLFFLDGLWYNYLNKSTRPLEEAH